MPKRLRALGRARNLAQLLFSNARIECAMTAEWFPLIHLKSPPEDVTGTIVSGLGNMEFSQESPRSQFFGTTACTVSEWSFGECLNSRIA
jgi:hypothetical protein